MFKRWWHLLTKSVAQSHKATVPRKLLSNISQPSVTFNNAANYTKAHNGPLFSAKKFNYVHNIELKNCTKIDRKVTFSNFFGAEGTVFKKCFQRATLWMKCQNLKPQTNRKDFIWLLASCTFTINHRHSTQQKPRKKVDVIIKPN